MIPVEERSEISTANPQQIPGWLTFLSAGLPSIVLLNTTCDLYRGNSHDLAISQVPLNTILSICLIFWLLLFCISHWGGRPGKWIWAFCNGYAVFWIIRDVLFPLPLDELNGSDPLANLTAGYQVAEAFTFLAALGILLFFARRETFVVLSIFVVVFGTSHIRTSKPVYMQLIADSPEVDKKSLDESLSITTTKPLPHRPDIYQILFDEYQTVEHEVNRETRGIAPYDDFILYKNNIANYNVTFFSLPSLMTSTWLPPTSDICDWNSTYNKRGLLKVLKEHGYGIQVYGYNPREWKSPYIDHGRFTRDIAVERKKGARADLFVRLLKLRMLPGILGTSVLRNAPGELPPITDSSYYCTIKFREMIDRIKKHEAGGNYVFAHMILPHGPFVMDEHGHYVGLDKGTRMGQVRLADKLTAELIDELKRLGRYDKSLIIIHADTGYIADTDVSRQLPYRDGNLLMDDSYPPPPDALVNGSKWPLPLVKARSQALLLVKPPNHHGYRVDDSLSQLVDIPPTIMGVLGLERNKDWFPEGVDLLSAPPDDNRVRRTYVLGVNSPPNKRLNGLQEWKIQRGQYTRGKEFKLIDRIGVYWPNEKNNNERIASQ